MISVCLHPKSRGHIRIRSTDPSQPPEIDPNYLSHPHDVACLIDSQFFSEIAVIFDFIRCFFYYAQPSEKPCNWWQRNPSGRWALPCTCQLSRNADRPAWKVNSTWNVWSAWRPSPCTIQWVPTPWVTIRPIPSSIPNSGFFLNLKLFFCCCLIFKIKIGNRVRGLKGLRVADASVLPQLTSGTPNSVVVAVAERAADFVIRNSIQWRHHSDVIVRYHITCIYVYINHTSPSDI